MLTRSLLLTRPLDLIWVSQVFWGRHKHLSIGDRRPERNHVEPAVVSNGSVLIGVNSVTWESEEYVNPSIHSPKWILLFEYSQRCTRLMPAEPLVKDCIGKGVKQDKDGIIGRQVSLSTRPVEEEVGQIVKTADHWVVHPLGGAVALKLWNKKGGKKRKTFNEGSDLPKLGTTNVVLELTICACGWRIEWVFFWLCVSSIHSHSIQQLYFLSWTQVKLNISLDWVDGRMLNLNYCFGSNLWVMLNVDHLRWCSWSSRRRWSSKEGYQRCWSPDSPAHLWAPAASAPWAAPHCLLGSSWWDCSLCLGDEERTQ